MGWEQKLGSDIVRLYHGGKISPPSPADLEHGTPNQKALFRSMYLGWAISYGDSKADHQLMACWAVRNFLTAQDQAGHMSLRPGRPNSNDMLITGNHYPIWCLAMAYIYHLAVSHDLALVLEGIKEWWRREAFLLRSLGTPSGLVVGPCSRAKHKGGHLSPSRDDVNRILGRREPLRRYRETYQDELGIEILRQAAERGEDVGQGDPGPFVLFDRLMIVYYEHGHVGSCPFGMRANGGIAQLGADWRTDVPVFDQEGLGEAKRMLVIPGHQDLVRQDQKEDTEWPL
jgi:hypothetical protein